MLLNEILEKPSSQIRTTQKPASDLLDSPHHTMLGTGAQAIAYLHKKFPGKVIKTIQIHGPNDPSYQFLRIILKHQDNPYFPKIFSVKMYPMKAVNDRFRRSMFDDIDPTGEFSPPPDQSNYVLYVVTERLSPLTAMTTADLERFGIEDFPIPQHMQKYNRQAEIKFRMAFKDADYRQYIQQVVKDPKLKQALRLLEPLFRHYDPDMHGGNIMRRGSQWVFMDPVAHVDSGGSE